MHNGLDGSYKKTSLSFFILGPLIDEIEMIKDGCDRQYYCKLKLKIRSIIVSLNIELWIVFKILIRFSNSLVIVIYCSLLGFLRVDDNDNDDDH